MDVIDDETLKTLWKNSRTMRKISIDCGFKASGGNYQKSLLDRMETFGMDKNHFDCVRVDNDKIFVVESKHTSSRNIKRRLVRDFDWPYEWNKCKNVHFVEKDGVLTWMNEPVVLHLDHINDINNDNRIENLRFLCPICHSQTSTYRGNH
jgi:hypothetical protein